MNNSYIKVMYNNVEQLPLVISPNIEVLKHMSPDMSKLEEVNNKLGFHWSLKPLFIITRWIVGVPLDFPPRSPYIFVAVFMFGIFIFLSNLLLNISRGINLNNFNWMELIEQYKNAWTFFYDRPDALLQFVTDVTNIMFFISVPLIQFVFMIIVLISNEWTNLRIVMQEIQDEMKLSKRFHRKCRNRCFLGLLLLVMDGAIFSWRYRGDSAYVADERWQARQEKLGGIPAMNPLPYVTAIWARFANVGILIVFVVLSFTAALLFDELVERAANISEECSDVAIPSSFDLYLEKLRQHYDLVCRFVRKIEDCFGLVLLLETARTFSVSIYEFHQTLQSKGRFPKYYFSFLHTIFRFFIVLVPSHLVTQQSTGLTGSIFSLPLYRQPSHSLLQINTILFQVSVLPNPAISALNIIYLDDYSHFVSLLDISFQWGSTVFFSSIFAAYEYNSKSRYSVFINGKVAKGGPLGSFVTQSFCPNGENYLPCECPDRQIDNFYQLNCNEVSLKQLHATLQSVIAADVNFISLALMMENCCQIPKDLFIKHRAKEIGLYGKQERYRDEYQLEIHPDAFRLSQNFTEKLNMQWFDMKMLNFSFLRGFNQLEILVISESVNVGPLDLPPLPSLTILTICQCTGLAKWDSFPRLTNTPALINLENNGLDDEWSARIIKQIPIKSTVDRGSYNNRVVNQYRAGDLHHYSSIIMLSRNHFSRLSSSVFEEMFKQLQHSNGALYLDKNPFNCSDICHLAWLIRDNPHLLASTVGHFYNSPPTCSNGTSFFHLNRGEFENCFETHHSDTSDAF